MHKGLCNIVFLCLLLCTAFPVVSFSQFENEEEMIKKAEKLFKKEEFVEAMPLFSQLTASYPNDPNYNYKYGACMLFGEEDKSGAVKFLEFAIKKEGVAPQAYFYLAKSYHLTYRFNEAIKFYKKFDELYQEKDKRDYEVDRHIQQCKNANILLRDVSDISVYEKKVLPESDFFRAYRLNEFKGNLLVAPPDLQTKLDQKREFKSLIMHHPSNDVIYFSSYGDKGTGGKDIYKRNKLPNGEWGEPINLGLNINTMYDEDFPYMHPDGVTFYFCSKGHNSIGGYDIFKSVLDTNTNRFGKPVNVGFAINSPDNDYLFISDQYENAAYFASTRENKQGEVTIYKIGALPRSKNYTIVQGAFEIEGEESNVGKIIVRDPNTGKTVSEYKTKKDGSFYMSLPSGNMEYEVVVDGHESLIKSVNIPTLAKGKQLNQKLDLKTDPIDELLISSNESQSTVEYDNLASSLQKSAMLSVNQEEDLQFNSGPPKQDEQESEQESGEKGDLTDLSNNENSDVALNDRGEELTNRGIVDDAFSDAKELQEQADALKNKSDVAFMLASQKSEQTKHLAKDIERLMEESENTDDPDRQVEITQEINTKQAELEELGDEMVTTYNIAKTIEEKFKDKQEEAEFAQSYAEDLEDAITSPSAEEAIEKLEAKRKELEEISQISDEEFSIDTYKEEKQEELDNLSRKEKDLTEEVLAIEEEKEMIANQAKETKNKELKQELLNQVSDLDEELEEVKTRQAKISEDKEETESEVAFLEEETDFFARIDESNSILSVNEIEQVNKAKTELNEEVELFEGQAGTSEIVNVLADKVAEDVFANNSNGSPTLEEVEETMDKIDNEDDLSVEQQQENITASLDRQKKIVDNRNVEIILLEGAFEEETDPVKKEEVYNEIQSLIEQNKKDEERASDLLQEYNQLLVDNDINEEPKTQNVFATRSKVVEEDSNGELKSFEVYAEENDISSSVESEELVVNDVNTETDIQDSNSSEENTSNDESTSSEIEEEQIASNDVQTNENNLDESDSNNTEIKNNEEENSTSEESLAIDNSESNESTNNSTPTFTEEELAALPFEELDSTQKMNRLIHSFDADSSSNDELVYGLEKAFGIKSNPDFEYGPSMVVQANVKNARRIERQALSSHLEAQEKREQAKESTKVSEAKKLTKEAQKLEEQASEKQLESSQNYQIANKEEFKFNQEEIDQALLSGEISNKKEAEEKLRKADRLMKEAAKFREQAANVSTFEKKVDYINKAYEKELEAISIQQSLITEVLEQREDVAIFDDASTNRNGENTDELNKELKSADAEGDNNNDRQVNTDIAEGEELISLNETNEGESNNEESLSNEDSVDNVEGSETDLVFNNDDSNEVDESSEENPSNESATNNDSNGEENLESVTSNNNVESESVQLAITEMDEEEAETKSDEEVFDQALKLRNMAAQAQSEEDQEALVAQAQKLEEIAKRKKLDQALKTYDENQEEGFKNLEVLKRVALEDEEVDELLMADMFENEADYYKSKAEEAKNEAQMYDDYNNQLTQYREAERLQKKSLEKQKAALDLYLKNNPDISEEDRAYIESLPDYSEENNEETFAVRNSDVEGFDSEEETSNIEEEDIVSNEVVEELSNIDSNEIEDNETLSVNDTVENNEEGNDVENNESEGNDAEEERTEFVNNDSESNEMDKAISLNESDSNDTEELVNKEENNDSSVDNIEIPSEYIEEYTTYYGMIQESEDQLNQAQNELNQAISLKEEAARLNQESEDKLRLAQSAETESEIEQLLNDADALRLKAEDKNVEAENLVRSADSNVSEAKSKKSEAEAYLSNQDPEAADIISRAVDMEGDKAYFSDYENRKASLENSNPINSNPITNNDNRVDDATNPNVGQPNLLGTRDNTQVVKEGIAFGQAAPYSSDNPIPLDPELPDGLVYAVQVGAFRNEIPQDLFKGMAPLRGENTPMGFIRYTAGMFRGFESANMAKNEVRGMGYSDAFVVAFYNGKRISLAEARRMIDNASDPDKLAYEEQTKKEVEELKNAGIGDSYQDRTDGEIANDIANVKGLLYTVQVGFYSKQVGSDKIYYLDPLYTENTGSGFRYTHGIYDDFNSADGRKDEVREIGVNDAFVVAYKDGERISVEEANKMLDEEGKKVLASKQKQDTNDNAPANSNSGSDGSSSSGTAGVAFKVQIGAYRDQVPLETAALFIELASNGVDHYVNDQGWTIYAVGEFNTPEDAQSLKRLAIELGINDAFITAYINGERVTMAEAMTALGR